MARALRFYDLLNRLSFAPSFRAKVVLSVLVCVLLPIGAMETYFIVFSGLQGRELERAILVGCLAAGAAATLAYWALSTILRPIAYASRQLNKYLIDRTLPSLPTHYKDEVGSLMSNINYLTHTLHDLLENQNENATFDHLTGIYNRRASEKRLKDAIELARIRQDALSFAIMDLDHFKRINDTYGHDFGDVVLRQVGDMLRTNVRRTDWVGRWGGDEFVIAVQGGEAEAMALLSRICDVTRRASIAAPDKSPHRISFSVGVCEWNSELDARGLYTKADQALYSAKRLGRDQVQMWSELVVA